MRWETLKFCALSVTKKVQRHYCQNYDLAAWSKSFTVFITGLSWIVKNQILKLMVIWNSPHPHAWGYLKVCLPLNIISYCSVFKLGFPIRWLMLVQTWGGDQIHQNNIIPDADCQIQQEIEGCGLCILWGDSCSVIWGQMLHTSHNTAANWENVNQTLFLGKMQTKLNSFDVKTYFAWYSI